MHTAPTTSNNSKFRQALSKFENTIKENKVRESLQSISAIKQNAYKPQKSTHRSRKKKGTPARSKQQSKPKQCFDTSTLSTESESDEFSLSPKISPQKQRKGNRMTLNGIPESTTIDLEASMEMSMVLLTIDGDFEMSQRKCSVVGSQTSLDDDSSRSSIISRMSPKVRSLPRDLDFDSDADSDDELPGKSYFGGANAPPPRFW